MDDEERNEIEQEFNDEAKKSHSAIDDAVRKHLSDVGITGITTGWVLITSVTEINDTSEMEGMYMTASDGLSKWAKIGLMTVALGQETDEEYF